MARYKYPHLVLLGLIWTMALPISAQGWVRTYPRLLQPTAVRQTPDKGFVFVANLQNTGAAQQDIAVVKTNFDGQTQWSKTFGGNGNDVGNYLELDSTDRIIAAGENDYGAGNTNTWLARLALDGRVIWEKEYNLGQRDAAKCIRTHPSGGYVAIADVDNAFWLLRLGPDGDTLWTKRYTDTLGMRAKHLEILPNGDLLIALQQNYLPLSPPVAGLLRVHSNGDVVFLRTFPHLSNYFSTDATKCVRTADNRLWLAHRDSLYRLDSNGVALFSMRVPATLDFYATDLIPAPDGGCWVLGTAYTLASPTQNRLYLGRFSPNGALWALREIPSPSHLHSTWGMARTEDGGFCLMGNYRADSRFFSYAARTDSTGMSFTNLLRGRVYWNRGATCSDTSQIAPLPGFLVKIQHPNGELHYASTDSSGFFAAPVGLGLYKATVLPPGAWWSTACAPEVSILFDTVFSFQQANFPLRSALDCALPWVDVGFLPPQPCDTQRISLHYANRGTLPSENAKVVFALSPLWTLLGCDLPFVPLGGNRYEVALGTLPPLRNGRFGAWVKTNCNATAGTALCTDVTIAPTEPCTNPNDQPLIVVSGRCEGDSVRFRIQNLGGDMDAPQEYIITEDNLVLFQGQYELGAGQQRQLAVAANGSTWRLEAKHPTGLPTVWGDPFVAAVVEGCTASGAFSTGFLNQYNLFDGSFFREIECREVAAQLPSQTKAAFPKGYDAPHNYIPANTELEYVLHFQNTTPDTLRSALLVDTLNTALLNVASISPGTASHPYQYNVLEKGVLRFAFAGLNLPPAALDSARSRAWVRFRVRQHNDLPAGTLIHNRALVFLGYEAPSNTNQTRHTVAQTLYVQRPTGPTASKNIWVSTETPTGAIHVHLREHGAYEGFIYDVSGRMVMQHRFLGKVWDIPDNLLPSGAFIALLKPQNGPSMAATFVKVHH